MKTTLTLEELNQLIRETLDSYYTNHDADSFFHIDGILNLCRRYNLTTEQVPALIEMQNVILMG